MIGAERIGRMHTNASKGARGGARPDGGAPGSANGFRNEPQHLVRDM